MNLVTHPLSSADVSIFSLEIRKICCIVKYRYRSHFDTKFLTLLTSFELLKIVLTNMVKILMMSTKIATLDLPKIKIFWNKGYEVIISIYNITSKILSRDSNYIVDLVMWPKFGNSSISVRGVIMISFLFEFDQKKPHFLKGGLGSSSIIWDWH